MSLEQATLPVTSTVISVNTLNNWLQRYVALATAEPLIGLEIVHEDRSGVGKNSYQKNFNERPRLTGVAVVVENDAAPEARSTPTTGSITGDRRGLRTFLTFQADMVSIENELRTNSDQLMEAYRRYWHEFNMALIANITASSGDSTTTNDLQNWDTVTALFRNDNHTPGRLYTVQHSDAIRDLRADLRTNAAALFGTSFGEAEARAVLNQSSGLGVNFDGYKLYESDQVPVGDTTGWTNILGILAGEDSTFEVDTYQSMQIRAQPDESRYGVWQVIGGIAGAGVKRQSNGRAFITKT